MAKPARPKKGKSSLVQQMEESIKLIKRGEFPKRDSLGNRLREMDGLDVPDALADPDELPDPKTLHDLDAENE